MKRQTPLDHAAALDAHGLNVLPARFKGKTPSISSWKRYQEERTSDRLAAWFKPGARVNYFVCTGDVSGAIVLDVDSARGEAYWRERIGDAMDRTACVETAQGHHFWFRVAPGTKVPSWSRHEGGVSFDVRADGAGVIVPPSVHPSGKVYQWVRGLEHLQDAPQELTSGPTSAEDGAPAPSPRSLLSGLLERPAREGGRNDWLTRVAGHYAKEYRTRRDAYEVHVRMANDTLKPPLPEREVNKTLESVWRAEHQKVSGTTEPTLANGFLVGTGKKILTPVKRGADTTLEEWADFDVRAVGVADAAGERWYELELHKGDRQMNGLLGTETLARADRLGAWLARYGCSIAPPIGMVPPAPTTLVRFQRYLEAQDAPSMRVVERLGWDRALGGFVTNEGVIRAGQGLVREAVAPLERVRRWGAHWRYGVRSDDEAREALREILTFQHNEVAGVFASWCLAALLKGAINEAGHAFPILGIEAPSGFAKTSGFFSLTVELCGNGQGPSAMTVASFRDEMSTNRSGIVWLDDLDDYEPYLEILRQSTREGRVVKKGRDNTTQEDVPLVAAALLSAESLGMSDRKAKRDRLILLSDLPPVKGRKSRKDPKREQWLDVLEFRQAHPDLTEWAGNLVRLVLDAGLDLIPAIGTLRPPGLGRFGDNVAIVRMGARVLSRVVDDSTWVSIVDEWATSTEDPGDENALTLKLLPAALTAFGWPEEASWVGRDGRIEHVPVFIDGEDLWFAPNALARWAEREHGPRLDRQTEDYAAIVRQARVLPSLPSTRRRFALRGTRTKTMRYWLIPAPLSTAIIERSRD